MNILMVTPMPPRAQAPGAIPVVLHAQLQALRHHHDVTLVTVAGPEPDEAEAVNALIAAGVPVRAALRAEPRGLARWRRRWLLSTQWFRGQWPWRTVWFWDPRLQGILDEELNSGRYDLVQIEDNAMGVYNYRSDLPTIFTEHEVRRPRAIQWSAASSTAWPRHMVDEADWRRWPQYQRRSWQKFSRLQVFTPQDEAALLQLAPELEDRVRVNPFGVELPPLGLPADDNRESLLFVGNFTHPPNVDAALWLGRDIFPLIREQRPAAELSLVGIFPPPAVLALTGPGLSVTGPVPDIAPYFQRAAVCVAPIRIGGGMRTKVLQAMAYGKPVVTTPRGAAGLSFAGELPPLKIAADADGVARVVVDLLADPIMRRNLGLAGRAFVAQHFSPQAYVSRLEAIYAELLPARMSSFVSRPARSQPAAEASR